MYFISSSGIQSVHYVPSFLLVRARHSFILIFGASARCALYSMQHLLGHTLRFIYITVT